MLACALVACATSNMPGYQNTYQGYNIPQPLLDRIALKFREHGLRGAAITRDSVGRVRLVGSYRNEDDVDAAFTIVQSIIGIKSTSPFYPQNVQEKRWEADAGRAISEFLAAQKVKDARSGVRRALVVGINEFLDQEHVKPILGEDDARLIAEQLSRHGYRVTSLYGKAATKSAIEKALADMEHALGPQDSLFIYVSSHGAAPLPTPQGGDGRKMSVIAYDSGDTNGYHSPDRTEFDLHIQRTSVKDSLFQHLAQRPTKVTRVVIDTCYSGEILRGVPDDGRRFILAQNGGRPERQGVSLASWSSGAVSAKGIQFVGGAPGARVQTEPAPFSGRPNYTVITATSEGEESWGPSATVRTFRAPVDGVRELKGSYFTQTFAAWLEVHNGQILPAFEQASAFTARQVSEDSKGTTRQTPRMFSTVPAAEDNLFKP